MNHFMSYLQIKIETKEQQESYKKIVEYLDNVNIKIPLIMKINGLIMYKLLSKQNINKMVEQIDVKTKSYINISDDEYEKLKECTRKSVKLKNSLLYKYHPAFISQRKFMKSLQDSGYQ